MAQREIASSVLFPSGLTLRLALVRSEFNRDITTEQLRFAEKYCAELPITHDVFTVAGAYEIPWMVTQIIQSKKYDGVVAIGCLIKGETPHFDIIAESVAQALMDIQIRYTTPVGFGIITANTEQQALDRVVIGEDATHAVVQSLIQAKALR